MSDIKIKFENFKILWYFFKPFKAKTVVVLVAMVVSGFLESLNLAALYPIINYGLKLNKSGITTQFLDTIVGFFGKEDLFLSACLLLIVVTIAATVTKVIFHYLSNQLATDIVAQNQKAIFDKFAKADYKFFVKNQQGRLVYAGTVAPTGVSNNILFAIRVVNGSITCFFFSVLLAILSWQGMLFIAFLSGLYIFFVRRILKGVVNKFSHLTVDEDRKKNIILNEFISGIKSIKAFFNSSAWTRKYSEAVDRSVAFNFKVLMGRVLPDSFSKFTFFVGFALIAILINAHSRGDVVSLLPLLGTFAGVMSRLSPYVNLVGNDIVAIARFMPDTKIVYDALHENMQTITDGTKTLREFKENIVFDNAWFKYDGTEDFLFKGLSLKIAKKKVTAIVGSSGSGKSTIVNLLLRLYDVKDGSIKIDGTNIREVTSESYLKMIGYVSQETFLFNGTIRENIEFGDGPFTEEEVIHAAKLANAHEFILGTEAGYQTIIGDSGMKLSGGQRQRLAIARAMIRKPQILIFDEATSSLDSVSERSIQEAVNKISQSATVVIIAHRLSTVQNADKIIVLEKGKIIEEGTHEELVRQGKSYYHLFASAGSV